MRPVVVFIRKQQQQQNKNRFIFTSLSLSTQHRRYVFQLTKQQHLYWVSGSSSSITTPSSINHNRNTNQIYYYSTVEIKHMSSSSTTQTSFVPGIRIPEIPKIPVVLHDNTDKASDGNNDRTQYYYPVNRIFCVGKNYSDHIKEMGGNPRIEVPCFFMKPSNAIVPCGKYSNNNNDNTVVVERQDASVNDCNNNNNIINKIPKQIIYPLATNNLQHEVELVVALGNIGKDGISNLSLTSEDNTTTTATATTTNDIISQIIYGYAIGVDLTRRDIQSIAKQNGLPWCTSKGFDYSAPISHIYPISIPTVYEQLHVPLMLKTNQRRTVDTNSNDSIDDTSTKLWLQVNGTTKQSGLPIQEMIWSISDIIIHLSKLYTLQDGDIIFTGTPAGVSTIIPNDHIYAGMDVLGTLEFQLVPR